ncbi:MAG: hypothetical protein JRI53_01120 [Deltaproteobacteria bacterium]|nr:hypothetical protein [Deltaproteobacteria bacterium]MBW1983293.1 hypothetical protein [Deltaproteobacteria bacterium]MBW2180467.1 hypothetical protein [Deltaproteobacteria bacterium]
MKKVIIIFFLLVTGYFVFQQYSKTLSNEDFDDEEDEYTYEEALPAMPASCSDLAMHYENAYYGTRSGDVSHSQKVFAFRKFKSCLREEGFSDEEIDATIDEADQNAKKKLKQDGYLK